MASIGTTRLYAAAIAVVSGIYSIYAATFRDMAADGPTMDGNPMMNGAAMAMGDWVMLGIGLVVLVHGVVLLTPAAHALGRLSGPLMVVWALVMLVNQGLAVVGGVEMGGRMAADAGMVAVAVLMLVSGLIMIARPMGDEMRRRG